MKKWVKFESENTDKVLQMLDSSNPKFMAMLGFEEAEIEESEKGGWYRVGTAPKYTDEELSEQKLQDAKNQRWYDISAIEVEVDGMKFNGDELSQDRMVRFIIALGKGEQVEWILADKTIATVTREHLREALRKSCLKQASLWANPYNTTNK